MEKGLGRKTLSFHILPRDSPGDGELVAANKSQVGTAHHRRRRRNKNRKSNLSLSSVDSLQVGLDNGLLNDSSSPRWSPASTPGTISLESDHNSFGGETFSSPQQHDIISSATCHNDSFATGSFSNLSDSKVDGHNLSKPLYLDSVVQVDGARASRASDPSAESILASTDLADDQSDISSRAERHQAENGFRVGLDEPFPDKAIHNEVTDVVLPLCCSITMPSSCLASNGYPSDSCIIVGDAISSPGSNAEKRDTDNQYSTSLLPKAELRQRTVHVSGMDSRRKIAEEILYQGKESGLESATSEQLAVNDGVQEADHYQLTPENVARPAVVHETPQLLDWERLMAANSSCSQQVNTSPFRYFLGEVIRPRYLQDTQSAETDKKRQHVYNTMFHVPWRCELLIIVGFLVCLDSFLSLFTVVPLRIIVFLWRYFFQRRQFQRLQADDLSDLGAVLVLVCGVTLLQQADISYIYHMIRSQATIKLYVVYNVLEIFDKLCQSFGSDVLQVVLNSAENVATCSHDRLLFESLRFAMDQCIAVFSFIVHSLVILAQSITVSAALRSHNNALLALLISNNFAEIKSNVFKRLGKDNLHKLAYLDTVERFHIVAHLFFVLAQNLLAANEPWLMTFASNAGMMLVCEVLVDSIKHAFLAKFNEIKPAAYSEFLLALCKQTLNSQSHDVHRTMDFVPFAPACVVVRVLVPLYAAHLPVGAFPKLLCIILFCIMTYSTLVVLKILVGLCLLKHANWYVERYKKKEKYFHSD